MSGLGRWAKALRCLAGELSGNNEKPAKDGVVPCSPPPPTTNSCISVTGPTLRTGTTWIFGTGRSGLSSWLLEEAQELWWQGKTVCFNGQKSWGSRIGKALLLNGLALSAMGSFQNRDNWSWGE